MPRYGFLSVTEEAKDMLAQVGAYILPNETNIDIAVEQCDTFFDRDKRIYYYRIGGKVFRKVEEYDMLEYVPDGYIPEGLKQIDMHVVYHLT